MKNVIIIPTWGRPHVLEGLLSGLLVNDLSFIDLVVFCIDGGEKGTSSKTAIDNFTQSLQRKRPVSYTIPAVSVWRETKNIGQSANIEKAFDIAFDHFNADYVLFLEDDLMISPDATILLKWAVENKFDYMSLYSNSYKRGGSKMLVPTRWFSCQGFISSKTFYEYLVKICFGSGLPGAWDNAVHLYSDLALHVSRKEAQCLGLAPRFSRSYVRWVEGSVNTTYDIWRSAYRDVQYVNRADECVRDYNDFQVEPTVMAHETKKETHGPYTPGTERFLHLGMEYTDRLQNQKLKGIIP